MNARIFKVQDLLHKEIASLIIKNIHNPIISKSVTISSVKLSKDLRYSEIFFTSFNKDIKKIENELNKASSYIRNELSKKIHLKRLPELKFSYDTTADDSQKIDNLINNAAIANTKSQFDVWGAAMITILSSSGMFPETCHPK